MKKKEVSDTNGKTGKKRLNMMLWHFFIYGYKPALENVKAMKSDFRF